MKETAACTTSHPRPDDDRAPIHLLHYILLDLGIRDMIHQATCHGQPHAGLPRTGDITLKMATIHPPGATDLTTVGPRARLRAGEADPDTEIATAKVTAPRLIAVAAEATHGAGAAHGADPDGLLTE